MDGDGQNGSINGSQTGGGVSFGGVHVFVGLNGPPQFEPDGWKDRL
jgi:hypothetical protein